MTKIPNDPQKKSKASKHFRFHPFLSSKDGIIARATSHRKGKAAVIGGGLLGLEAAKALVDLGMEPWMVFFLQVFFCIRKFWRGSKKHPKEMPTCQPAPHKKCQALFSAY